MINAAVIGLGRWGKTLVTAVQGKSTRIRFVHGVSKEPDDVRDFARQHNFRLSTDLEDAIANPEVRAIFLATPHSLHVDQVIAVAAAGKHVWCEKPLALKRADAERAVEACHKAGVVLGTGTSKRCYPSMRELKRLVSDRTLGEILHIEGNFSNSHSTRVTGGWRDDPSEAPGYGMTGAGLHVLDAFVNLVGPVSRVYAKGCSFKAPPDPRDALAVFAEFESGATGLMATVRATQPYWWRVHVFGTKGMAEVRGEDTLIVSFIGDNKIYETTFERIDSLQALADSFADAVAGKAPFLVPPQHMLDLVGVFEASIKSIEKKAPVNV